MANKKKLTAKKKREFSKMLCLTALLIFAAIGVWMIHKYFALMAMAIACDSAAVPDAALPIAGLTVIFAPIGSYLLYQAGLKNSRNKYGIDANGEPFVEQNGGGAQ